MPYPLPLTRTEAYLAYKAGVIQQSDLKPSLAVPRNGIDAWLAYWTGLASYYPIKNLGKNIIDYAGHLNAGSHDGLDVSLDDATGQITVSGQPTRGYAKIVNTYDITNLLEDGKEYTISQSAYDNKLYAQVNAAPPTGTPTYIYSTSSAKTFTVDKSTYPRYLLVIQTGAQSAWTEPQTITRTFQIEKGSSASAFEPYTGEPLILQEEEAYIAYLSGVINEYPEKCLRRVGAYLRYLISARWGRPDHPLNREELYLSLIKTQVIPSGDPSSDIVIDGTAKAPFVDVRLYGDTFQQTYTGQNLYDVATLQTGATVTKDDDGWITITKDNSSGSSSSYTNAWTSNLALETNTQYVIFLEVKAVSGEGEFDITSTNSTQGQFSSWQSKQIASLAAGQVYRVTPTTKSSFSGIHGGLRTLLNLSAGQSASITFRLSVLADTSVTTSSFVYEPYTGGQPSPSPSYPRPIQTVTGEQAVSIIGKNLFNKNAVTNGGYIDTNGEVVEWETFGYSEYIRVIGGQTYSYSGTANNVGYSAKAAWYDSNKNFISAFSFGASGQVTAPATAKFLRTSVRIASPSGLDTYQLELGSTITTYEAYKATNYPINLGSIELCNLGTYQDYIRKDGDDWKVHKATKTIYLKYITWLAAPTSVSGKYRMRTSTAPDDILAPADNNTKAAIKSSVYGVITAGDTYSAGATGISVQATTPHIFIYDPNYDTASSPTAFTQKMVSTNATAYYALATPTDTTITDQTLIAQLDSLVNGGAEDGTTYIKVNATDPNLPGLLYVEAPKYE